MLEFQGDFEHSDTPEFDGLTLGQMKEATKGNYELLIGNHLLRGKISDLPKPLIMTEKIIDRENAQIIHKVKAIIKRKILFQGRPTPLRTGQSADFFGGSKQRHVV